LEQIGAFLSFDSKDPMLIFGVLIFQKIQNHMIGYTNITDEFIDLP